MTQAETWITVPDPYGSGYRTQVVRWETTTGQVTSTQGSNLIPVTPGGQMLPVGGANPPTPPPTQTQPVDTSLYQTFAPLETPIEAGGQKFTGIIYGTEQPAFPGQEPGKVYVSPIVSPEQTSKIIEEGIVIPQSGPPLARPEDIRPQTMTVDVTGYVPGGGIWELKPIERQEGARGEQGFWLWETPLGTISAQPWNLGKELGRSIDINYGMGKVIAERRGKEYFELYDIGGPSLAKFGEQHPELTVEQIKEIHTKSQDITFQVPYWASKLVTGETVSSMLGDVLIKPYVGQTNIAKNIQASAQGYKAEQYDITRKFGLGARQEVLAEQGPGLILAGATAGAVAGIGAGSQLLYQGGKLAYPTTRLIGNVLKLGLGTFGTAYGVQTLSNQEYWNMLKGTPEQQFTASKLLGGGALGVGFGVPLMASGIKGIMGVHYEPIKYQMPGTKPGEEGSQKTIAREITMTPMEKPEYQINPKTGQLEAKNVYVLGGVSEGKPFVGTPDLANVLKTLPEGGYFTVEGGGTAKTLLTNIPKWQETTKGAQAQIGATQLKTWKETQYTPSKFGTETFSREMKGLTKEGFETTLKWTQEQGGKVRMWYGSKTAEVQMEPGALGRKPGDIDILLNVGEKKAEVLAQDLASKLKASGEQVKVVGTQVQTKQGGEWVKAVDIHSTESPYVAPERGYGIYFEEPPVTKEGIKIMSLSETGGMKTEASMKVVKGEEGYYFGTEEGRGGKHIPDVLAIKETLYKSQGPKGEIGIKDISQLRELYLKEGYDLTPGGVEIDFTRQPVSTTVSPTLIPSVSPSYVSASPSISASPISVSPSWSPSPSLSPSVSVSPSPSRSVSPSLSPSLFSPSISPSISPTISPSISTSISPSVSPSISPSFSPSPSPSLSPSPSPEPPIPKPTFFLIPSGEEGVGGGRIKGPGIWKYSERKWPVVTKPKEIGQALNIGRVTSTKGRGHFSQVGTILPKEVLAQRIITTREKVNQPQRQGIRTRTGVAVPGIENIMSKLTTLSPISKATTLKRIFPNVEIKTRTFPQAKVGKILKKPKGWLPW